MAYRIFVFILIFLLHPGMTPGAAPILVHDYKSNFANEKGDPLVLEFIPLEEHGSITTHHAKYTTFDEERLEERSSFLPELKIASEQKDPPWSYHGKWHPAIWHKIPYTIFRIPQEKDWKPNNWGYSLMRFMPDYDEVAVNENKEDFQILKKMYKTRIDATRPPRLQLTYKHLKVLRKHAFLRTKLGDGMTVSILFRAKQNIQQLDHLIGDAAKDDSMDNIAVDRSTVQNAMVYKEFRFMYILALEHVQDHSGEPLTKDAIPSQDEVIVDDKIIDPSTNTTDKDPWPVNIRQPHFFLQKNGSDWKEQLDRFGLDDENYCWWNEQSPFDIITHEAEPSSAPGYRFNNALRNYRFRMFIDFDATTLLTIQLEDSHKAHGAGVRLSGGALTGPDLYLDRIHVKYGKRDGTYTSGSEHTIDQKGYAMELQLIFTLEGNDAFVPYYFVAARSLKGWKPFREKLVMILSVLVEVRDELEKDKDRIFEPLAQAAYQFRKQVQDREVKQFRTFVSKDYLFRLSDFIPDSAYYVYRGSLTHPPCIPYVMWSVYSEPLLISTKQFDEFLFIPATGFDDNGYLADNVRHIDQIRVAQEDPTKHTKIAVHRNRYIRTHRSVFKSHHVKNSNFSFQANDASDADSRFDYSSEEEDSAPGVNSISLLLILSSLYISLLMS